jgi:hypothetical protein
MFKYISVNITYTKAVATKNLKRVCTCRFRNNYNQTCIACQFKRDLSYVQYRCKGLNYTIAIPATKADTKNWRLPNAETVERRLLAYILRVVAITHSLY